MKKCFSLLLTVFLFLSSVSFAATYDEESYLGIWIQKNKKSMKDYQLTTFVLEKDHTAFYSVESYDNETAEEISRFLCSWSLDGNMLTIMHGDKIVRELYRINDYQLSVDPAGIYNLYYNHVPNSQYEYDTLSDLNEIKPIDRDPCGMWSFYFDSSSISEQLQKVWDNKYLGYNLYLLSNGSVYMTQMNQTKDASVPSFSSGALDGIWIGGPDDMTLRVSDKTYKAKVDESGRLLLYMTENLPLIFVKVDQTDALIDQL